MYLIMRYIGCTMKQSLRAVKRLTVVTVADITNVHFWKNYTF